MPVTKQQRAGGVLLVTDRQVDEGALGFAARVARALDAPMAYWIIVETLDEMRAALPLLRKETALLQETAPEVKAGLKRGLAAEILSGIGADDYELVILSFRGRRGLKKVFPRAEILSILHHGKVNFLVLWGRRMEVRKVLFCTGGSPYGQQAVEYGARLAAALEAPATLLYVTETEPGLFLGRRAKAPEMEEETKEALEKAVETLEDAGIQSTLKVRHGTARPDCPGVPRHGGHPPGIPRGGVRGGRSPGPRPRPRRPGAGEEDLLAAPPPPAKLSLSGKP